MALTQRMQWLLMHEAADIDFEQLEAAIDIPAITYCRNLKEKYCHVLPHPHDTASCNHPIYSDGTTTYCMSTACHECPEILLEGDAGLGPMLWDAVRAASDGK